MVKSERLIWKIRRWQLKGKKYSFVDNYTRDHQRLTVRGIRQSDFTNLNMTIPRIVFRVDKLSDLFKKSLAGLTRAVCSFNSRDRIAKRLSNAIIDEYLKLMTEKILEGETYISKGDKFRLKIGYSLLTKYQGKLPEDGLIALPVVIVRKRSHKTFAGAYFRLTKPYLS